MLLPSRPTRLLSVAGRSPQVITETLYCLLVQRRPPVDVREVHVLTTRIGAERVREELLRPRDGWLHRLCRDYGIPAGRIRCDAACLHVPEAADGGPLEDVRTPPGEAPIHRQRGDSVEQQALPAQPPPPSAPRRDPRVVEAETLIRSLKEHEVKPQLQAVAAAIRGCPAGERDGLVSLFREHQGALHLKAKDIRFAMASLAERLKPPDQAGWA